MILRRMAQILRVRQTNYPLLCRTYGTRRTKRNHYEILRISPLSTRKEIRAAYVKLSKEMHPDVSKKDTHQEFVEINEAYKVLSKEATKRQYDESLHRRPYTSYNSFDPRREFNQRRDFDHRRDFYNEWYQSGYARGRRPRGFTAQEAQAMREKSGHIAMLCVVVMVIATIVQLLLVKYSFTLKRDKIMEQSKKFQLEFEELSRAAQKRNSFEQQAFLLDLERKQQEYRKAQHAYKKSD